MQASDYSAAERLRAPEARELGANTDWLGFREGLLRGLPNVSGPRADAHAVVLMAALVNED